MQTFLLKLKNFVKRAKKLSEIDELITHITDEHDREIYKQVLKNQFHYIKQNAASTTVKCPKCGEKVSSSHKLDKILPKIVVKTLDELIAARDLFGIQPMQGPVGLVYRFRVLEKEKQDDGLDRVSMEVVSNAVEAQTRKLQASWTVEAAQDMTNMHGIDIENEIVDAIGHEIAREIIDEMFNDMRGANVREVEAGANLVSKIYEAANEIHKNTKRGRGNFVILSPAGLTLIQSDPKFKSEKTTKNIGRLTYCGKLDKTIKVYCDQHNKTLAVVGYKGGTSEVDCGLIYSPYIMLLGSGIQLNPLTFQPTIGLMTRYGKTFDEVSSSYYVTLKEAV